MKYCIVHCQANSTQKYTEFIFVLNLWLNLEKAPCKAGFTIDPYFCICHTDLTAYFVPFSAYSIIKSFQKIEREKQKSVWQCTL